jgi:hypothetical protein
MHLLALRAGMEIHLLAPQADPRRVGNAIVNRSSAASTLNLRVQPLQFRTGVVDFELPVHATLFGVCLLGPDPDL